MTSTELEVIDTVSQTTLVSTIDGLNTLHSKQRGTGFFTTLQGDDRMTKLTTLAAMTDSVPLVDHKNVTIWVEDVLIHSIEMENSDTKRMELVPRIILIDREGAAFHAISGGLMKSLENIFMIMGSKDQWGGAIPIKMEALKGGKGTYYTAKVDLKALAAK